ncbi:coiled-coil domain-containing protein [Allofranklinella schreckenbergeri]|nr:hypothetical protein [Allofranklinella schreckenbergeri]
MNAAALSKENNWFQEVEKTIVQSLVSSFGLDFLLFKDQVGGNVDTIHNVRQGIYATEAERKKFESRPGYSGAEYHSHKNYIEKNARDKELHAQGRLYDEYRGKYMATNEIKNLDHVVPAFEVWNDRGRFLAEVDGVELANRLSNLQSTHETINKSKKAKSMSDFISGLDDNIAERKKRQIKHKETLELLQKDPQKNKEKIAKLERKISTNEEKIKELESIDKEAALKKDREARAAMDKKINERYYLGEKFIRNAGLDAGKAGVKMGVRQTMGLLCAEIWMELKEQTAIILDQNKKNFDLSVFFERMKEGLKNIFRKIKERYRDFISAFNDGVLSGVMSSINTTLTNIFVTTSKNSVKIIRELWGSITKALKLIFLNPEKLDWVDLGRSVTGVVSAGISTLAGTLVHGEVSKWLAPLPVPFKEDLAAFAAALTTGLLTLGLGYLLLYSSFARKAWEYFKSLVPYGELLEKYQEVNEKLDQYLLELGSLEFNINVDELNCFSRSLGECRDEMDRSKILSQQIEKMEINIPFKAGNQESVKKFLVGLAGGK